MLAIAERAVVEISSLSTKDGGLYRSTPEHNSRNPLHLSAYCALECDDISISHDHTSMQHPRVLLWCETDRMEK